MLASELINKLQAIVDYCGDVTVSITDGHNCVVYIGDFGVEEFVDTDDTVYIDIGVGGLLSRMKNIF